MEKYKELNGFPEKQFRRLTGVQRETFEKMVEVLVSTLGFLKTSRYLFDPLKYRDKQLFVRLLGF